MERIFSKIEDVSIQESDVSNIAAALGFTQQYLLWDGFGLLEKMDRLFDTWFKDKLQYEDRESAKTKMLKVLERFL